MNKQYQEALKEAKIRMSDVLERGNDAIGSDVIEFMDSLLTPEERAKLDLKAEVMGRRIERREKARNKLNSIKSALRSTIGTQDVQKQR